MGNNTTNKPSAPTSVWAIPDFPVSVRQQYLGECKKRGLKMKLHLANLIRGWIYDVNKKG